MTLHLKNIYAKGEADQTATCKDFLQVQKEEEREVKRNTSFYSLEAIIAVGYRVNSERGTQFRQWATAILKKHGEIKKERLKIFDFNEAANNHFLTVRELWVQGCLYRCRIIDRGRILGL